jgi:uncharacterized protein YdeI (YjbR/CyaY-like superfamily)
VQPGDRIDVRLRAAPDDRVEVPDDVELALRMADATDIWNGLTPGKQRGLLYPVSTAKTAPTREKRIAALIATVTGQT